MPERARPGAAHSLIRPVAALELLAKGLVLRFGNTQEVGDHVQGEGSRVIPDELALASLGKFIDLAVGPSVHERLVLAEALGRNQPHQQAAMCPVLGRVERGDLVTEGQFVSVLLDEVAHVVTLEWDGKTGKGPGDGVARREGRGSG